MYSLRLYVGHCPFGNKFLIIQKKKKNPIKGALEKITEETQSINESNFSAFINTFPMVVGIVCSLFHLGMNGWEFVSS